MNSVNIIGRLVKDPDVKRMEDGLTICNLRLAIDDPYSKENRSDFINVTVFGNQGEVCKRYLRKGFMAGVSGRINSDSYTDSEGVKRYPVKIVADRVQILQWPEREQKNQYTIQESPPECEEADQDEVQDVTPEREETNQDAAQECGETAQYAAPEYAEISLEAVQEPTQGQPM